MSGAIELSGDWGQWSGRVFLFVFGFWGEFAEEESGVWEGEFIVDEYDGGGLFEVESRDGEFADDQPQEGIDDEGHEDECGEGASIAEGFADFLACESSEAVGQGRFRHGLRPGGRVDFGGCRGTYR